MASSREMGVSTDKDIAGGVNKKGVAKENKKLASPTTDKQISSKMIIENLAKQIIRLNSGLIFITIDVLNYA